MNFSSQVSRRLHEEHDAVIALWGRVQRALALPGAKAEALTREALAALDGEIGRHFDFEEQALFPRLADHGQGDIGELLTEEHAVIRAAAARARAAIAASRPEEARIAMLELAELIVSHAQKEEFSLLPAVDDLLDAQTDDQLTLEYAAA